MNIQINCLPLLLTQRWRKRWSYRPYGEFSRPGDADVHCAAAASRGAPPYGRRGMTIQSGNADYPHVADMRHLRRYRVRRVAGTIMALSPPILCACLANITFRLRPDSFAA